MHQPCKERFTAANFATSIVAQLNLIQKEKATSSDTGTTLPESARSFFLTLHVLFPHCLLDALDLIDRGLVHKSVLRHAPANPAGENASIQSNIYYVRSVQTVIASDRKRDSKSKARSTQSSSWVNSRSYQVHLHAWNCSCPAFAFAAFSRNPRRGELATKNAVSSLDKFCFGAATLNEDPQVLPPICKHLLACVLFEHCGELCDRPNTPQYTQDTCASSGSNQPRYISVHDAAGWAAGADIS